VAKLGSGTDCEATMTSCEHDVLRHWWIEWCKREHNGCEDAAMIGVEGALAFAKYCAELAVETFCHMQNAHIIKEIGNA